MTGPLEGINAEGSRQSDHFRVKAIADLFKHPGPSDQFLTQLLAMQCRAAKADRAVMLRAGEGKHLEILAVFPAPAINERPLDWVASVEQAFRKVMASGASLIVPQYPIKGSDHPRRHLILVPIHNEDTVRAVAAFRVQAQTPQALLVSQAHLETTALLLDHHELRLTLNNRHTAMNQLDRVLEALCAVNRSERFLSAAMALCNETATQLACNRVSLGFLKGRCVHVRAISHMDRVSREMKLVQALEAAMEECLDQDEEVIYPAAVASIYVSRATATLCENHGSANVLSLPIRKDGEPFAVMTLERPPKQPFDRMSEIEVVRLICDLCSPRLSDLHLRDRWLGARLAAWLRKPLGWILGHEQTWIKGAAVLVLLVAVLLTTVKGNYRIDSAFTFEAQHQQAVVAPFDSFFKSVAVAPGDTVEGAQTILGSLETAELRLKLAAHKAEQRAYQKQMTAAMRDRKTADAQIAQAQSDKLAAEIRLMERKIDQATLVAPISGRIVSEDLTRQIGAPVETGKILFEIARIESLWAELYVPESSIANITTGQTGELACVGHPDKKIGFVIARIDPIAEVVDNQNVFRVRAGLNEHRQWMRPGMEGKARISAGKRSYLWIGTHRLVDWLRMKLWL